MKRIILSAAFTSIMAAYGQNWSLGVRLGDPSGITLKKYMNENAFELSVGRTYWFYGKGWYEKHFDDWYLKKNLGYREFQYWNLKASVPLGFQIHYLFRKNINRIADEDISGLEWYFGFGGQLRFQKYYYDYRYKLQGDPNWHYATGGTATNIDLGGDGVIGLEYTFKETPISLFIDLTLFMEVVDDPFLFWFQGGIGGRYNFRTLEK